MATQAAVESGSDFGDELTRGHKKKARTRQLLVDAALRIYARKGIGGLVLHDLAEEAGVSHGTIYNYFHTREEVLEAVGIAMAEQFSLQVLLLSEGLTSGAERMAVGIRSFIKLSKENRAWAGALIPVVRYSEGMKSALTTYIRADLQRGVAQGEFHFANEEVAVGLVQSATIGAIASIVDGLAIDDHDNIVAEMVLLALGVPPVDAGKLASQVMPRIVMPVHF